MSDYRGPDYFVPARPSRDPHSDAWGMPSQPTPNPTSPSKKARVPWPDGRVYRHTDGVICGAGQNQLGIGYASDAPDAPEVRICLTHGEEVVLAPRFEHEDDGSDCEATEGQVTRFPGEAPRCTLHEDVVRQVW